MQNTVLVFKVSSLHSVWIFTSRCEITLVRILRSFFSSAVCMLIDVKLHAYSCTLTGCCQWRVDKESIIVGSETSWPPIAAAAATIHRSIISLFPWIPTHMLRLYRPISGISDSSRLSALVLGFSAKRTSVGRHTVCTFVSLSTNQYWLQSNAQQ
jgi:hypothetical protein